MFLAVLFALGSVALGTLLGLLPGAAGSLLRPVRSLGLVAALLLVAVHLLPDAVRELGPVALACFLLAWLVPGALDGLLHARHGAAHHEDRAPRLGLELGYVALLVHQVGDGLALGFYGGILRGGHVEGLLALSSHTVPVTALLVLTFAGPSRRRAALVRAGGVATATVVGVVGINAVPYALIEPWQPWIAALASGLLLHIVLHGPTMPRDPQPRGRALELAAIALACVLSLYGARGHGHDEHDGRFVADVAGAFVDMARVSALPLLLGIIAVALVQSLRMQLPDALLRKRKVLGAAAWGAVAGGSLPVCACGALNVAQGLRARGASAAFTVAFVVAAPLISFDVLLLTISWLALPFAAVRLQMTLLLAVLAGAAAGLVDRRSRARASITIVAPVRSGEHLGVARASPPSARILNRPWAARLLTHVDGLVAHLAPWMAFGVAVGAWLAVVLPPQSLAPLSASGNDVFVAAAVASAVSMCAGAAVPIVTALVAKGLSFGAALTALVLVSSASPAAWSLARRTLGLRPTLAASLTLVIFSIGLGLVTHGAPFEAPVALNRDLERIALGVLVALMARGALRDGIGAWLDLRSNFVGRAHAPPG